MTCVISTVEAGRSERPGGLLVYLSGRGDQQQGIFYEIDGVHSEEELLPAIEIVRRKWLDRAGLLFLVLCAFADLRVFVSCVFATTRPQHGANVKITTPSTNHNTAKIKPYPKNSRKFTRATPATITYQNGAIR